MQTFNIIHSCTSLSFSGLEHYVLDLAETQKKQGLDVLLFCRKDSELEKHAIKKSIPTATISHDVSKGPRAWLEMIKVWSQIFLDSKKKNQKLILHMHAGGEPVFHLPWLLRSSNFYKVILQFHLWINLSKKDPWHAFIYSRITEVWCSSESAKKHLQTILPFSGEFRVVKYGRNVSKMLEYKNIHTSARTEVRNELAIPENAVVFLCVSRIEPMKGILELLLAFEKVSERLGKNNQQIYILVAGDVSPQNEEAKKYYDQLILRHSGLSEMSRESFKFLGFRSDYYNLMLCADFYVLPSYEECMSLAMLDAFIFGLPVLGTNAGGTPSVVRPGETGFLFSPKNSIELADRMTLAFDVFKNQSEQFDMMSVNAAEIGASHAQENIFQNIIEFYN